MLAMFLVIIIFLIILSSDAFAFQVSPAKITQLEQDQMHEFLVRVDTPSLVSVSFEGDLAEYASANNTYIEDQEFIPVRLQIPTLRPGTHELLVVFQTSVSSGEVGANAQIVPKIRYVEKFEGAYIESTLTVRNNTQPLELVTVHENFGTQAGTTKLSFTLEDEQIQDEFLVEDIVRKDYKVRYEKGEYLLKSELNGERSSQMVAVGEPTFQLEQFDATMGEIAVFDLVFSSDWNVPREEVLVTIVGEEELESQTIIIPGETQVFWEDAQEGNVTVEFQIAGQEFKRELTLEEKQETIFQEFPLFLALVFLLLVLLIASLLFKNKERFK